LNVSEKFIQVEVSTCTGGKVKCDAFMLKSLQNITHKEAAFVYANALWFAGREIPRKSPKKNSENWDHETTYNPFMESLKRKRLRLKTHWSQGLSSCYQICWAAINLYCKYTVY